MVGQQFDAEVAILGMGSAGLLTATHLAATLNEQGYSSSDIIAIGKLSGGSSVLSSWYVAQYDIDELKIRLINGLGDSPGREQIRLVEYIADHHVVETNRFKDDVIAECNCGGIKQFVDGFSGIAALTGYSTQQSLPGAKVLRYLRNLIAKQGVRKVVGSIENLSRESGGYRIETRLKSQPQSYLVKRLVIATGGMAHTKDIATSAKSDFPNVLELARDRLGIQVANIDSAVFFPFALREDGFRAGSLLPPSFMTRADIIEERPDGQRIDFMSNALKVAVASGNYRPQFAELVELFTRIRENGSKVLVETRMSEAEFEEYRRTDHYGYVFKDKSYNEALSLSVAPAYHSALGGIIVNHTCTTSDPRVFAVGESALVYGTDRPIGGEHVSAITMAPVVADELAARIVSEQQIERSGIDKSALDGCRTLIDTCDDYLASRIDLTYATTEGSASDSTVNEFLQDLINRVSKRPSWRRQQPLTLTDVSVAREYRLEYSASARPLANVIAVIEQMEADLREPLIEALVERLHCMAYVGPLKHQLGLAIRDESRESAVVQSAVERFVSVDEREFTGGLYQNLILPVCFVLQQHHRNFPAPATESESSDLTAHGG